MVGLTMIPEHPVPEGTLAPVARWTPHTSMNGLALRPDHSTLPGLNASEGEGFTVYATVYGSWNTILPQGHEILRIDFTPTGDENASEPSEMWTSKTLRGLQRILERPSPSLLHRTVRFTMRPSAVAARCTKSASKLDFTFKYNRREWPPWHSSEWWS